MSNSLMVTQALRLLKSEDDKSIAYIGYWLGELFVDFLPEIWSGYHCNQGGEPFNHLTSLVTEARIDELIDEGNWKNVTNRNIYIGMTQNNLIVKAERDSGASMKHTWMNLKLDYLLSTEREILFLLSHNKLLVKERKFRMGLSLDPYCDICLTECGAVISDTEHVFCKCLMVASMWRKIRALVLDLLGVQRIEDLSMIKLNFAIGKCPIVSLIIGSYVSKVWRNDEGGTICEAELFGYLRYKFKALQLGSRSQIQKVWDFLA